MYDYFKIWIEDATQIERIVSLPLLSFTGLYKTDTGEIIDFPQVAKWSVFEIKQMSKTRVQITGSLHKYWNGGTNENDFFLYNVANTIKRFCNELQLNPQLATIHNLEYGVNINPSVNASELIEEIICFKNVRPQRPYDGNDEQFYFIEFKKGNNYFKIYDKGKQYDAENTLRIEIKSMRSKELMEAGAITLNDLMKKSVFQVLGRKVMQFSKCIVFNDRTLNIIELGKKEKEIYKEFVNPNKWKIEGRKSTTQYRKERRFIEIVIKYGKRNIYSDICELVKEKIEHLKTEDCNIFLSKYNGNSLQKRCCVSCGRDICNQHSRSKFCSSNFVGEAAAHRCRNKDSNRRNNFKRKIERINRRGVLFDVMPFITQLPKIGLNRAESETGKYG